ncbi:MAG: hypothetical protein JW918_07385 [Anaerolineae bacterium]|nr:hypothetical protein [Anaerolineae bacterium]
MKEKETTPEKTIVIDIKLTRGLVVALSCVLVGVALLTCLTLTGESAAASEVETAEAVSSGMRLYYLTQVEYKGNGALSACATGYHFASFWELADPSNLKYNTSLGYMRDDSGYGPPYKNGWVRTGYVSSGTDVPGRANCLLWTSDSGTNYGTRVNLPSSWTSGDEDMGVWEINSGSCSGSASVWCIED